ncbi:MAG: Na/Pi cotransporter family protein [Planctomycetaceae bacterium]|nr:Na/Pi cotransporter family protein [Planctomycetaceae bacterium]
MVASTQTLELGTMGMGLLAGLALFLFGIEQMTDALKVLAGERMKALLARLTTNRFKAVFAGAFVTSVIQSSSVTTVLLVGFISAGLLSLEQAIGVIMGSNIGTTVTAQIIAFKVTHYAPLLIAIGFALLFLSRNERLTHYGNMIMGLGLVFFGMQMMSGATEPLRDYPPFVDLLTHLENPLTAITLSAVFTAIIQSSSATTGVIIVLASQGLITLELGIALVLGANIGTCITALLAAIGKPREAVKASVAHVLFNVVGVLIWWPLIAWLAVAVREISPAHPNLSGTARLAAETPRQIANAHTIFNVANTLLLIGFTVPMAALVDRLVPKLKAESEQEGRLQYLKQITEHTPALALDIVRMEVARLGGLAVAMLRSAFEPVISGDSVAVQRLRDRDDEIDRLHGELVKAVGRLSQENLTDQQSRQLHQYMAAANYFEGIGDLIETSLCEIGKERNRHQVKISDETRSLLSSIHQRVTWTVEESLHAVANRKRQHAENVIAAKAEIATLADGAEAHLLKRLTADQPRRTQTFRIETDLIEGYRRLYYFARRIAKVIEEGDELENVAPKEEADVAPPPNGDST